MFDLRNTDDFNLSNSILGNFMMNKKKGNITDDQLMVADNEKMRNTDNS